MKKVKNKNRQEQIQTQLKRGLTIKDRETRYNKIATKLKNLRDTTKKSRRHFDLDPDMSPNSIHKLSKIREESNSIRTQSISEAVSSKVH